MREIAFVRRIHVKGGGVAVSELAVGLAVAFLVTLATTLLLARYATKLDLIDAPDAGRKFHEGAVPAVGGLAMGVGLLVTFPLVPMVAESARVLAVAIVLTLLAGYLDDRYELGPVSKFAFQIAAAAMLVKWGHAELHHLGKLVSPETLWLGRWSVPLSLFAIIGVMNAMNMIDGLDGLAGSIALSACLGFFTAALFAGDALLVAFIWITGGAVVAFLVFNARTPFRSRAAVFMGDSGSLLLGLLLAWFAIRLAMADSPGITPVTAIWILAVPLADTVALMTRRLLRGRSPCAADRQHMHHILLALGLSQERTVALMFVMSLAFGFIGFAAHLAGVPEHVMFYIAMVVLLTYGVASEVACRRLGLRKSAETGA